VRLCLFGAGGKVGAVLGPALERGGHDVVDGREDGPGGCDAAIDFTRPDAVLVNAARAFEARVPHVVGTTGFDTAELDRLARDARVPCLYAPNFALGAVLMMRLAAEAARHLPRAEIVELHGEGKKDAPSGTARATAEALGGVPVHSVRLPGLVAHQEVLFGGDGQLLTIRHDAFSREAYVPGVLLALERLQSLPSGLTVGLDALLD
jgi:4-hydroxy-tetrahydrodipicolinate reductase